MGAMLGLLDEDVLSSFELEFVMHGVGSRLPLRSSWDAPFDEVDPVRKFSWRKDAEGFAGFYYSVTMQDHVGYESWLERDRMILLDRDPGVAAIASQPFRLHWHDGSRKRGHAPDYFIRLADGRGRVVDVRAEDDMDDETREAFEATERACRAVGWEFEWLGEPAPVLMANVRWLSRYRRPRCGRPTGVAARLREVFREPRAMWDGAEAVGDRLQVLPVLFHLLWAGVLVTNLADELMQADSLVWTKGAR